MPEKHQKTGEQKRMKKLVEKMSAEEQEKMLFLSVACADPGFVVSCRAFLNNGNNCGYLMVRFRVEKKGNEGALV